MTRYFKLNSDHKYLATVKEFHRLSDITLEKIDEIQEKYGIPEGDVCIFSTEEVGFQVDTNIVKNEDTKKNFNSRVEFSGRKKYQILRKNSKLHKEIKEIIGDSMDNFHKISLNWSRYILFGTAPDGRHGNLKTYEEINGDTYVSFADPEEAFSGGRGEYNNQLEEIPESDYLRLMADKLELAEKMKDKKIGGGEGYVEYTG